MENAAPSYRGHRYPVEVISHCVWWYFRFPLGFREVQELMFQRGVIVSHEAIRRWCPKRAGHRNRPDSRGDHLPPGSFILGPPQLRTILDHLTASGRHDRIDGRGRVPSARGA